MLEEDGKRSTDKSCSVRLVASALRSNDNDDAIPVDFKLFDESGVDTKATPRRSPDDDNFVEPTERLPSP